MNKQLDYLIIGQGLAGTFLAFQLLQQKKSFLVIDQGHQRSSSYIAAGIINPLVLKRLTVTWRADEFLNYNSSFYEEIESLLGKKYHFELPIHQLINNEDALSFWSFRFKKAELSAYLEEEPTLINAQFAPSTEFKVGRTKQTSWLNISELLDDFREYLRNNDLLLERPFRYSNLHENTYESFQFSKIVFCEGAAAVKNPYFNKLPFSLNKGQLLTIESHSLPQETIYKKKVFILPTAKNEFKVGATYSWNWDDDLEIEKEKTEVLKKQLEEMTRANFKLLNEKVGIRPAVKDRRPLMGVHFDHSSYYIFNGMGSRGCFMAPLLSKEMVGFMNSGKSLNSECDIKRFHKKN